MGNTADVFVWASADRVMKFLKRCNYASNAEHGFSLKGCICHAILNEGERLFQTQHIYIYIYMKADKGVVEIKFFYPMFAGEGML